MAPARRTPHWYRTCAPAPLWFVMAACAPTGGAAQQRSRRHSRPPGVRAPAACTSRRSRGKPLSSTVCRCCPAYRTRIRGCRPVRSESGAGFGAGEPDVAGRFVERRFVKCESDRAQCILGRPPANLSPDGTARPPTPRTIAGHSRVDRGVDHRRAGTLAQLAVYRNLCGLAARVRARTMPRRPWGSRPPVGVNGDADL